MLLYRQVRQHLLLALVYLEFTQSHPQSSITPFSLLHRIIANIIEKEFLMSEYKAQTATCSQGKFKDGMRSFAIAMAYVPWQRWDQTYELKKAMCVGTIFPELDKPFLGKRGACK